MNKLLQFADAYKQSHHKFYPPGTEYIYSYLESRGNENNGFNETVFFGLELILYLVWVEHYCNKLLEIL